MPHSMLSPTRSRVAASSRVHRALISGVTPVFRAVYTLMGRVFTLTPVTNRLMITSSRLMAKLKSMPETMAGSSSGRVMVKNTCRSPAPRSRAASARLRSMPTSRACTSMNT